MAAAQQRPGDALGWELIRRSHQRPPPSAPPKVSSQLPCTPSPRWGTGLAALPPARQRGRIRQAVPARPRRTPGQITANPRQIWSSGGKTTVNGRQVGSRQSQCWADRSGAAPWPPGTPCGVQTPQSACSGRIRPWDHPPQNRGALAGLSLMPWQDPLSVAVSLRGQGCAGAVGDGCYPLTASHPNTSQPGPTVG